MMTLIHNKIIIFLNHQSAASYIVFICLYFVKEIDNSLCF